MLPWRTIRLPGLDSVKDYAKVQTPNLMWNHGEKVDGDIWCHRKMILIWRAWQGNNRAEYLNSHNIQIRNLIEQEAIIIFHFEEEISEVGAV